MSSILQLGTTRAAAGSAENFTKIDKDYVINAAKAAKTESDQRLLYLSSMSASASSFMLYTKCVHSAPIGTQTSDLDLDRFQGAKA